MLGLVVSGTYAEQGSPLAQAVRYDGDKFYLFGETGGSDLADAMTRMHKVMGYSKREAESLIIEAIQSQYIDIVGQKIPVVPQ